VISLFLFEGYSHKEIASELGISESTSKTQYIRGKKKLRELLTQSN
jgi:RNA polymerase sigma-70 factor (ECF subfamily)